MFTSTKNVARQKIILGCFFQGKNTIIFFQKIKIIFTRKKTPHLARVFLLHEQQGKILPLEK